MHVYAKNCHCDEWNDFMLEQLNENLETCHALDTKKDTFTQLLNIVLPEKPSDTGNLRKDLHLKVGARVMITTNIDVSDGLTNGAMGFVTNLIPDQKIGHIVVVLVMFDHDSIGQDAKRTSIYKHVNKNSVPILQIQVSFPS